MYTPAYYISQANFQRREIFQWNRNGYRNCDFRIKRNSWFENRALLLLSISNARNFAMALDLTIESIEDVLNEPQYAEFSIPKKSGNKRIILKPGPELMYIQNRLNHLLQCYYYLIRPKEAHGFVLSPDKNEMPIGIVSNALPHVGKRTVLNIDLHNFFSTI